MASDSLGADKVGSKRNEISSTPERPVEKKYKSTDSASTSRQLLHTLEEENEEKELNLRDAIDDAVKIAFSQQSVGLGLDLSCKASMENNMGPLNRVGQVN